MLVVNQAAEESERKKILSIDEQPPAFLNSKKIFIKINLNYVHLHQSSNYNHNDSRTKQLARSPYL